jgi:hypothetical protein
MTNTADDHVGMPTSHEVNSIIALSFVYPMHPQQYG